MINKTKIALFGLLFFAVHANAITLTVINQWDDVLGVTEGTEYEHPKEYKINPGNQIKIVEWQKEYDSFAAYFKTRSGSWARIPNCDGFDHTKSVILTFKPLPGVGYPSCQFNS